MERREHRRLQLRLSLSRLTCSAGPAWNEEVWTDNVSAGGMYFRVPEGKEPECGQPVSFELTVPPGDGHSPTDTRLEGTGTIVRTDRSEQGDLGVAVRFARRLNVM